MGVSFYASVSRLTEAGLKPGKSVKTKPFSKKTEESVSKVLPTSYDIESYCNLVCKIASAPKNGVVKLTTSSKSGSDTFEWPVDCLSKGYGIVTK